MLQKLCKSDRQRPKLKQAASALVASSDQDKLTFGPESVINALC